jgi:hypothetical protein
MSAKFVRFCRAHPAWRDIWRMPGVEAILSFTLELVGRRDFRRFGLTPPDTGHDQFDTALLARVDRAARRRVVSRLAGGDLHRLSGGRIASHACRAILYLDEPSRMGRLPPPLRIAGTRPSGGQTGRRQASSWRGAARRALVGRKAIERKSEKGQEQPPSLVSRREQC